METTLGTRIKLARGTRSQAGFSALLEISKGSLGFYERDENLPNADVILKICSTTGVELNWLMTGTGPMSRNDGSPKAPFPSLGKDSCQNCAVLYKKLDTANERLFVANERERELLKENSILKEDVANLRASLSLSNGMPKNTANTA